MTFFCIEPNLDCQILSFLESYLIFVYLVLDLVVKLCGTLHPTFLSEGVIDEFFVRLFAHEVGILLKLELSDSFDKHATLCVFSVYCVLLHDVRLLRLIVLKVFWAEVRIENVETITAKDRFKVNFATDLVIDS